MDIKGEDILNVEIPDVLGRFFNITEHLSVRKAVFNTLVKTLFDAAHSETGVPDLETFLNLLDEAKAVDSKTVFLPLSSATADELVTAFKNLLPQLNDDDRSRYIDGLVHNGWLPSRDAVGFGVEKTAPGR